jgi:hypothetical protein
MYFTGGIQLYGKNIVDLATFEERFWAQAAKQKLFTGDIQNMPASFLNKNGSVCWYYLYIAHLLPNGYTILILSPLDPSAISEILHRVIHRK